MSIEGPYVPRLPRVVGVCVLLTGAGNFSKDWSIQKKS